MNRRRFALAAVALAEIVGSRAPGLDCEAFWSYRLDIATCELRRRRCRSCLWVCGEEEPVADAARLARLLFRCRPAVPVNRM